MSKKSKIEEIKEASENNDELTEEEKEKFMQMLEKIGGRGTEMIKKLMILPAIYGTGVLCRAFPDFTRNIYPEIKPFEQPFSSFLISKLPGSADYTAPIIFMVIAYIIMCAKGNIFAAASVALTMIFTESTYSYASQNVPVSLSLISVMFSLFFLMCSAISVRSTDCIERSLFLNFIFSSLKF